jgi:PTH1 family peptidyl-tRNA hydrolase
MESLRLVVGLGNPGGEYARTRHNAGFLVTEELAARHRCDWRIERKFKARMASVTVESGPVMLCQPQTFMNASGESVSAVVGFYRIAMSRLLIVTDDADLEFGQLRMRASGSSGGHHGLESIEAQLGRREYPRLRVGIGRTQNVVRQITNHVLGRFARDEEKLLEAILKRAADQVECWWSSGIKQAMNQFNGAVIRPDTRGPKE